MLLTLSAGAYRGRLDSEKDPLTLFDLPEFTITELGLRGLGINASQLAGFGMAELEQVRDCADKASCPVLLLNEDTPLDFGSPDPNVQDTILERIRRLGLATTALGASSLGVACGGTDNDETFDQAAATIRRAMQAIDRHEVNLLLRPTPGLTEAPERLTELIKKVGGFRIGSLPDFRDAHLGGDFVPALRRLAPYAGAVYATLGGRKKSDPTPYSLEEGLEAVLAVGYQNTICLHYEGTGDPTESIIAARDQFHSSLEDDEEE